MKRRRWLVPGAMSLLSRGVALLLLATGAAHAATNDVAYELSPVIVAGELQALAVTIRFHADASGSTTLDLPDAWADRRELWRHVRALSVDGARSLEEAGPAKRIVRAAPRAKLTVRYQVVSSIDHEPTIEDRQPYAPWIRPTWFYATGEALFAVPHGRSGARARFDWTGAPKDFAFASDLEHLAGAHRRATGAGTVGDLQESVVIGGRDVKVETRMAHGAPVRIATRGRYAFSDPEFFELATRVVAAERDFWRDKGLPFLITLAPVSAGEGSTSLGGTGRTGAFALTMTANAALPQVRFLMAHEYFHNWNPRGLGGLLEGPDEPTGYWFREGFTDFYTRRLLLRYGLVSLEAFIDAWNDALAAYGNSPARLATNARIKSGFWTDSAVEKLPYQRGAMLAARWDARLRAERSGRFNLDDVLREQRRLRRGRRPDPTHDAALQFRAAARRFGFDPGADIERYVEGGEFLVLADDTFAPCLSLETIERLAFDRGFDTDASAKAGNVVTGLREDSPAYAAGLRDGMKLIRREAGTPGDSTIEYALRVEDNGSQSVIRYRPEGRERIRFQRLALRPGIDRDACRENLGGALN